MVFLAGKSPNIQLYGQIWCVYTALVNPTNMLSSICAYVAPTYKLALFSLQDSNYPLHSGWVAVCVSDWARETRRDRESAPTRASAHALTQSMGMKRCKCEEQNKMTSCWSTRALDTQAGESWCGVFILDVQKGQSECRVGHNRSLKLWCRAWRPAGRLARCLYTCIICIFFSCAVQPVSRVWARGWGTQ
jgi:hypothetical protein